MPSRGGRARWVVLAGLVALGGLAYLAHQQAGVLVGRSLNLVFNNADTEAGAVWFDWNGDVIAKDVVLYLEGPVLPPPDPAAAAVAAETDANTLRFERLRIRTPGGWMFFLQNVVDRQLDEAMVDALRLTFEGFDTNAGVEPTLGTLGPIGALSASPFESEGCMAHAYFVRSELADMGLDASRTTFDYDVRGAASRIDTRIVLNTPGASRVQYDRVESIAKETSLLKLPETATSTSSERWDISDQGFVRARNAFCAKQDGVDPATFVARHLASVQRLLETRGLVVDPATLLDYADFAEKGGQLAFGGTYASPLHSSERAAVRHNGSALLRLAGKLEHGSRNTVVQWSGTQPRALETKGGATFAAVTKENGGIPPAAVAPVAVPVANAGAVATPVAAANAGAVAVPATPPTAAPQRPQYASSFASAQPLAPPGGRLAWEDLPRYQGRMLQVFTMHTEPRTAMLISANGREAHVRARMEGGHADYRISREAFLRALLIN